jgi:DNA modification methylase
MVARFLWSGFTARERDSARIHPTQKPVALIQFFLSRWGSGDVVEPFAGSGTTLVACENLGRRGRGIEISPEYCAVVLERMATAFPGIEIERMLPRAKMDDDENGAK